MQLIYQSRQWFLDDERKPSPFVPTDKFRAISPYPYITRDITVTGDEYRNAMDLVVFGGKYLEKVYKLYAYAPKNNQTYRIVFQSLQRNLTNEEVDEVMHSYQEVLKVL